MSYIAPDERAGMEEAGAGSGNGRRVTTGGGASTDPLRSACPYCHEVKWSKAPHAQYILCELGPQGPTTGGIPVEAYLCTVCYNIKIHHNTAGK